MGSENKKRILFVDDEPAVLEGLQNQLYRQRRKWDMVFVSGGEQALAELQAHPFDVIVSDMRMPGMDGGKLLQTTQEKYPNVVRVVLSGYSEQEAALRAVPVAHQFLTKPCKAEILENVVQRACSLQALVSDDVIRRTLAKVTRLPPVPKMYSALTRALAAPDTDVQTIAGILEQDMAMCAKLLQLVNSSFFVSAMPITNIQFAVMRLGFQMVKNLTLMMEVFSTRDAPKVPGFSMEVLQRHAALTAQIAKSMLPDKRQSEDAFMAGLLHDVGKLVMAAELPDTLKRANELAAANHVPVHAAEQELFGVTHAEIGAYLLGLWGLPYPIVEAVGNHHAPSRVEQPAFDVLGAVHIADVLAHQACDGMAGGSRAPNSGICETYLQWPHVQERIETWRQTAIEKARGQAA